MRKKDLIILGLGAGWADYLLDKNRDQKEIWAINNIYFDYFDYMPLPANLTAVFMMDGINGQTLVRDGKQERSFLVERANELYLKQKVILITPFIEEGVKGSVEYPLDKIVDKFKVKYFKSTLAFMLAYIAWLKCFQSVEIYGCNLAGQQEFFVEKPCVEFWLGVLTGQGVNVVIRGGESFLLRQKNRWGGEVLYGYEKNFEEL